MLIGALCEDETRIARFGRSEDTEATIAAVRRLGVDVYEHDVDTLRVFGVGVRGLRQPAGPIDCANAGTLMRLLSGILAGQDGTFDLVGDASLSTRPMERVAEPLRRMGAAVEATDGHPPLHIEGAELSPIDYELPVASAQVKSAVLLAGVLAHGGATTVVEPVPTRDHTERLLELAGARVARRPRSATVWPAERLSLGEVEVPGDFSSAAPFIVAATLVPGSELHVHGVNLNPRRTGLLDLLERMGARITVYNRRLIGGEPAGDLDVRHVPSSSGRMSGPRTYRPRSTSCRCSLSPRPTRGATVSCAAAGTPRQGDRPPRRGGRGPPWARRAHPRDARRLPGARGADPAARGLDGQSRRPSDRDAGGGRGLRVAGRRARRRCESVAVSFPGFFQLSSSCRSLSRL